MTPYDVAVVKNSSECARYLKSLGGRTANEIVAKLKLNSHTESTKKGKNKLETSSSSDETPKTRRERLKSEERTSFNGNLFLFYINKDNPKIVSLFDEKFFNINIHLVIKHPRMT